MVFDLEYTYHILFSNFVFREAEPNDGIDYLVAPYKLGGYDDYEYNDTYDVKLALVPHWFNYLVRIFLSTLGTSGILLNCFIIYCFVFRPEVSY